MTIMISSPAFLGMEEKPFMIETTPMKCSGAFAGL